MVQYMGGKAGSGGHAGPAKVIAQHIAANKGRRTNYVEPFLGGGSVWEHTAHHFTTAYAGDAALDLMLMWQSAASGWVPPIEVSETEYKRLRSAPPSALRGFVGFACSWGGKWFGGFARGRSRNYAAAGSKRVTRIAAGMRSDNLRFSTYQDWDDVWFPSTVVYADPPYEGTTPYSAVAGVFEHENFWRTAEWWCDEGGLVWVSEYAAPDNWVPVLEIPHYRSFASKSDGDTRLKLSEKLWMREDQASKLKGI